MPLRARTSALVGLGLLATGCAAGQRADFAVGQIMTPGNTQVPLPPGEWKELASEYVRAGSTLGGGINNDNSVRVYYAKIEGGRIAQLAYVRSSAGAPNYYGYATGADCVRTAPSDFIYFADVRSSTPNAIDCVKVTGNRSFSLPGRTSPELYRQAYENAKAYGGLPRYAVQVEIAQAHSQRFEDYYLAFFPDQSAARTRSADWRADDMSPASRAVVDGIVTWARGFRDAVRLGTEYRL